MQSILTWYFEYQDNTENRKQRVGQPRCKKWVDEPGDTIGTTGLDKPPIHKRQHNTAAKPNGNVGIAGEIKIYTQRVAE